MADIIIKDLRRKDYSKTIDFAIAGMHFGRYIKSKIELRLYVRYFFYFELNKASQVIAAYLDDQLAGVLLADIVGESKKHISFWRGLYVKMAEAIMAIFFKDGVIPYDNANDTILNAYNKSSNADGEICFLAADPNIQGKGIGTRLLDELAKREKGKLLYLFTDDNCTYQFYEHKGFRQAEEIKVDITVHSTTEPIILYIYDKQF